MDNDLKELNLREKLLKETECFAPDYFPIGMYWVTKDGILVKYNQKTQEILKLPPYDVNVQVNITDFYWNPDERIRLIEKTARAESNGGFLEKEVIRFKIGNKQRWIQDYCRSIKDKDNPEEIIGYIGCILDVTEEENSRRLFEKIPLGIYELDAENRIIHVNNALAQILEYKDSSELIGQKLDIIYVDRKEAENFDKKVKELGVLVNEIIYGIKKTKERCYLSVNAYLKTDSDGKTYLGWDGTIQDVTRAENYRQLLDKVPVGTYMIEREIDGKETFYQCNAAYAKMFGYSPETVKGKAVNDLFASGEDYEEFLKIIREKYKKNKIIEGIQIKGKTSQGVEIPLEDHFRVLTDKDDNIIGRTGIVLDTSNEVALHEMKDDIGRTLHFFSAALVTLEQSVKPLLKVIGPDPFEINKIVTPEKALEVLSGPAKNVKIALEKLMLVIKTSPEHKNLISDEDWETVKTQRDVLTGNPALLLSSEFQIATLHEISIKIQELCHRFHESRIPRELLSDLLNKSKILERTSCLIKIHQVLDMITEIDYPIRALRENVIFQQRKPDNYTICQISSLIQTTVFQHYLYASQRRIDIIQEFQNCQANVLVDERSILRALSNLYYNAIKYSWYRDIDKKPWISIKAKVVERKVHVEFQNYGVPITEEELKDGLIFNFGYRGKYSGDRNRIGTGVGLNDSRETARKHGGDVIITSHPASEINENDYSQPFITTATLILPLYLEEDEWRKK